jgi:hypothetical protein
MEITDPVGLMGDLSSAMDWKQIDTAPFNRDLELAVILQGRTWSLFPVALRTTVGSISKLISEFIFSTHAPPTGEIGYFTKHSATITT